MRDNDFFLINCEVCSSGVLPMCDTCTLMLCFVFVSGRNEMVSVWKSYEFVILTVMMFLSWLRKFTLKVNILQLKRKNVEYFLILLFDMSLPFFFQFQCLRNVLSVLMINWQFYGGSLYPHKVWGILSQIQYHMICIHIWFKSITTVVEIKSYYE